VAIVTANGLPVLDTGLYTPRVGAWHTDLLVDAPLETTVTRTSGLIEVSINDGALTYRGTTIRSGDFLDVARLRVVAGAAGLGTTARPKRYGPGATLGVVLGDLLRDAGEVLDATAQPAVLGRPIGDWTTPAIPVGAALAALFARVAPDAAWRMTPLGAMWVGVETWPDAGIDPATFELAEDAIEDGSSRYLFDAPVDIVGKTFDGRRVSCAQFRVAPSGPVIADVWTEVEGAQSDRLKAALAAIVRAVPPGLDQRFRYWAKVVQQSGGTIHVLPEESGLPDMGNVKLALGPGESISGVAGGRVLVGWDGARAAYAEGFDGGVPAERILDAGATFIGGKAGTQPPPLGTALMAYLTTIAAAINALAPGAVLPPNPAVLLAKKTNVV
jgi:hypothetical protein